jgi:CBS domain-containing protein
MPNAEYYTREVVSISPDAPCREIAEVMKSQGVGSVVVNEDGKPVGIVTDRDLLRRVVAEEGGTSLLVARDVMSHPVVSVSPEDPLERAIEAMSSSAIRRLPVVSDGELVGIMSLDDLLTSLTEQLDSVVEGTRRGFRRAQRAARSRRIPEDLEHTLRSWGTELERLSSDARERVVRQIDRLRERLGRGS